MPTHGETNTSIEAQPAVIETQPVKMPLQSALTRHICIQKFYGQGKRLIGCLALATPCHSVCSSHQCGGRVCA
eukprot:6193973-Pleurochrysis_carterae.AAC.2